MAALPVEGAQIKREYMAHYLKVPGEETNVRIGKGIESLDFTMNANVSKTRDITGENPVMIDGYEPEYSAAPFYARMGDPLFLFLQSVMDEQKLLDELKTVAYQVKAWTEASGSMEATAYDCIIEVVSGGGDTTGYQIPFNVHISSSPTKGTWSTSTKTFTPQNGGATGFSASYYNEKE